MARRLWKKPRSSRQWRVYGPRWQAENVFSRHKRLLGSALRARSNAFRERECLLHVLTRNIILLARQGKGFQQCKILSKRIRERVKIEQALQNLSHAMAEQEYTLTKHMQVSLLN